VALGGEATRLSKHLGLLCGLSATGVGLSLLMMLPYAFSSEFGPVITGIEARALPAFLKEDGYLFDDDPLWWLLDSTVVFCQMYLNIH